MGRQAVDTQIEIFLPTVLEITKKKCERKVEGLDLLGCPFSVRSGNAVSRCVERRDAFIIVRKGRGDAKREEKRKEKTIMASQRDGNWAQLVTAAAAKRHNNNNNKPTSRPLS